MKSGMLLDVLPGLKDTISPSTFHTPSHRAIQKSRCTKQLIVSRGLGVLGGELLQYASAMTALSRIELADASRVMRQHEVGEITHVASAEPAFDSLRL